MTANAQKSRSGAKWYEDRILAAVSAERLKTERHTAVPVEDAIRRLTGKRNNKHRS